MENSKDKKRMWVDFRDGLGVLKGRLGTHVIGLDG